ncbi:hypothetical protein GOODEAATRI_033648 [Goodea atripinnis]|uniref:Secreted protein n=1 Tax=Goodea atripinnis TaxID=208336 RepID=A0ABV0P9W3_9TELE
MNTLQCVAWSQVSRPWTFTAVFAAESAAALPLVTESGCPVCAAHLTTAKRAGNKIASKRSDTCLAFKIGFPSDFKKERCFHNAPKSCTTPKEYLESVYIVTVFASANLQASVRAIHLVR